MKYKKLVRKYLKQIRRYRSPRASENLKFVVPKSLDRILFKRDYDVLFGYDFDYYDFNDCMDENLSYPWE